MINAPRLQTALALAAGENPYSYWNKEWCDFMTEHLRKQGFLHFTEVISVEKRLLDVP